MVCFLTSVPLTDRVTFGFKATPHNQRLKPLHTIRLQIFRHLSQIFLERRQPSCVKFRKPDEKSDGVSGAQWLCGVALKM